MKLIIKEDDDKIVLVAENEDEDRMLMRIKAQPLVLYEAPPLDPSNQYGALLVSESELSGKAEIVGNPQAWNVASYLNTLLSEDVPFDVAHELTIHYQDAIMGVGTK